MGEQTEAMTIDLFKSDRRTLEFSCPDDGGRPALVQRQRTPRGPWHEVRIEIDRSQLTIAAVVARDEECRREVVEGGGATT